MLLSVGRLFRHPAPTDRFFQDRHETITIILHAKTPTCLPGVLGIPDLMPDTLTLTGSQLAVGSWHRDTHSLFILAAPPFAFLFILSRLPRLVDLYCSSIPLKDDHLNSPWPPCLPFVALS